MKLRVAVFVGILLIVWITRQREDPSHVYGYMIFPDRVGRPGEFLRNKGRVPCPTLPVGVDKRSICYQAEWVQQ